jgi:hypothetical protein
MTLLTLSLPVSRETLFLGVVILGSGVFLFCVGLKCFFDEKRKEDYPGQRYIATLGGVFAMCFAVSMILREARPEWVAQFEPYLPVTWRGGILGWLCFMGGVWMINVGLKPWFDDNCKPVFPGAKYVGVPVGLLQMILGIWLWIR